MNRVHRPPAPLIFPDVVVPRCTCHVSLSPRLQPPPPHTHTDSGPVCIRALLPGLARAAHTARSSGPAAAEPAAPPPGPAVGPVPPPRPETRSSPDDGTECSRRAPDASSERGSRRRRSFRRREASLVGRHSRPSRDCERHRDRHRRSSSDASRRVGIVGSRVTHRRQPVSPARPDRHRRWRARSDPSPLRPSPAP